ncbi:hypothetical protein ACNPQK_15310 [Acinetobacter guillouiae]|uniref:hypothetical protein n=1 Tax=Acinetobacter guillouiae TaxID=106649 RepID=UPI003AF475C5
MPIAKQEVVSLYNEVKESVSHAINDISAISLSSAEEQNHILNIKNRLNEISQNFNQEINNLEKNSEWDKFTIAFFGETNAGKSTIIESLRIVFKEKERQKQIENGEAQLVDLEKTFSENTDILIAELNKSMQEYTNEIRNIKKQISVIKRENQLAMNNTLFVIMGVVLGVILTFVYQWII